MLIEDTSFIVSFLQWWGIDVVHERRFPVSSSDYVKTSQDYRKVEYLKSSLLGEGLQKNPTISVNVFFHSLL